MYNPSLIERGPRSPPIWVAITYVCHRWRAITLDFRKLWYTITPDLSPKWLVASLQRSSYSPRHVDIRIGPLKKPRRFLSRTRKRPVQEPLTTLPSGAAEVVLYYISRIEHLSLKGDTPDIIRILTSLGEPISLTSLSLGVWDGFKYQFGGENEQKDVSLILPESLFGGSAPRFRRLYCHSGFYLTFPSWVLRNVSEFTVSLSFSTECLFSALSHMPQLEVFRVQGITFLPQSNAVTVLVPVNLKNLTLLVIEDTSPEFLLAFLSYLSMPANVRKHLKLTLNGCNFRSNPWEGFTSLIREMVAESPDPLHGIHLTSSPSSVSICVWASPTQPGVAPSPWPPLDDSFRLEIRTVVSCCCLQDSHIPDPISSLHRLQELCISVGGQTVQELYVECRKDSEPNNDYQPTIWCHCWRSLFSKFPSLETLHFGDGAEGLLVSACNGPFPDPWSIADDVPASRDLLFRNLRRLIVSRSTFSTRTLWNWVHYAFARPAEWDLFDLKKDVQALLLANRRKSVTEDVMEGLLLFLLYFRPVVVHMFEVSLVKSSWDNPGGLEILQRLLHMLDPNWNVILEATIPPA